MRDTVQEIQSYITGSYGREMALYETIDSTNNAAKLLAKNGALHGSVVVATRQTNGKGRLGRQFDSPAGAGIYITFILRPTCPIRDAALLLTPAAAVAVSRAIAAVSGVQVKIKWVNDLYFAGKKLCGILTESAVRPDGTLDYAVVGIGVNCKAVERPPELQHKITSIEQAGGTVSAARLIAEICNQMEEVCEQLESRAFLEEYRARSCVLGRKVTVVQGAASFEAQAVAITDDAALVVRTKQGEQTLCSGEISLRGDFIE